MKDNLYDSDLIINTSKVSDGRYVIDLNLLSLKGFLEKNGEINRSICGVSKSFFDLHLDHFSEDMYKHANLVANFIKEYEPAGRMTVFNSLKEFFEFQVNNGKSLRDPTTIQDYCLLLQSRIYSREIGRTHARSRLSVVNNFLIFTDEIYSSFKYSFSTKNYKDDNESYTKNELSTLIEILYEIFENNHEIIKEHLNRCKNGFRHFPISQATSIKEVKLLNPKITFDYIIRNPVYWFMHSSFLLFCLYTWSNEKQLCESDVNDFKLKDGGVESELIYKGRAHKFIRLNIGTSGVEGDKTGIIFFNKFLEVRNMLLEYLKNTGYITNHNALLFMINLRDNEVRRLVPALNSFQRHPIVVMLESKGVNVPNISSRRLRKTVEQHTDNEVKNPFITLEKAQHTWGTYRKNYAQGNHEDARKAMTSALKLLTETAISNKDFDERKNIAEKYDITLLPKNTLKYQINGIACKDISGNSSETKKFIRHQAKYNRSPKLCANFLNCINCPNCALVEDENAIYHLLSFQHLIDFEKAIYVGSNKANNNYNLLVSKIDFMLIFIDQKTLAKARNRLQNEGVSDLWKN